MTVSVTQTHWWSFRSPHPDRRAYRKAKAAPRDPGKNVANARRDRFEVMKQVARNRPLPCGMVSASVHGLG